jgi:hypothetical protein
MHQRRFTVFVFGVDADSVGQQALDLRQIAFNRGDDQGAFFDFLLPFAIAIGLLRKNRTD